MVLSRGLPGPAQGEGFTVPVAHGAGGFVPLSRRWILTPTPAEQAREGLILRDFDQPLVAVLHGRGCLSNRGANPKIMGSLYAMVICKVPRSGPRFWGRGVKGVAMATGGGTTRRAARTAL